MRLIKTNMRRGIALLLVSAMLITSVSMGAAIGTKAVRSAQTVSFGSLLADNAPELGDAEKGILRSGLLAGDTFTYISPDNSDGLIAVDPDAKKITVSPYTDELGNMWTADVCRIVYDGGKETVALIDGEGRFEYDGSSYAAEADYKLTVSAGDPTFTEKLLKAPYMLAKGVDNLNVLCSYNVQMPLDVLAQNKDLLQIAADGFDLYAPDGSSMGHVDLPCKPNAQNLLKQYNANGGKFDLKVRGDECIAADAKTAYLISGGQNIKKAAADTYKDFSAIYADLTNSFYQSAMVAYQIATQETIDIMCTTLSKWLATVKPVAEDSWAILENTDVLKPGLTDAQYAELDTLIAADATLADRPFNGAVPETLTVNTSTVEAEVNRYAVTVQVLARVIDRETKDSAELTALPAETSVLKMIPGSTGAEILSRIEASGVEESALAGWDSFYGVNEDNYIRSVSEDLTGEYTLENNITYTITYTPRTLTVTYGEGYGEGEKTPAEVPYGYQMKLPAYNGDLVYDYTVNGSEADQGDVVRITGNTSLSRVTGKAWNYYGIGKLVSGNYATGDTVAQNILTSTALRTGTFRLRTPGNSDGLLSMDSSTGVYTVTAKAFKADTGDLWWIPETGTLKGGEADGTAISFALADGINYTAEFDAGLSFDRIAVNYKVVLPWEVVGITAEEALEILNLPHVLTTEAKEQLSSMETLNGEYANFEALNDNINALWVAVNGSDLPQESKDAMKDLLDNCLDGDGTLYLYSYLNEYRACETNGEKLAVYYLRYDGATGIKAQIDKFCEDFKVIAIDNRDSFVAFLNQMKYGQYVEKIDRIYSALTDIQTNLIAPNGAVDTADDGLNALTELVADAIDQTKAYGTELSLPVMRTDVSLGGEDEIYIQSDGTLMGYSDLAEAFANVTPGCTLVINEPVSLNSDVAVSVGITVSGADKILPDGHKIRLTAPTAVITADADLSEAVEAGIWGYKLNINGTVYSLVTYAVTVRDDKNSGVLATDDINEAFAKAPKGSTVYVNLSATLRADVTVSASLAVSGAGNIKQNGKAILLAVGGSLKTDAPLTVTTKEAYREVVRTEDTYTLAVLNPTLTGSVKINAPSNVVKSYKVDASKGLIILEANPVSGITAAQLEGCVAAGAKNAASVKYSVSGVVDGRVKNGAILTVTASNTATSKTATKKYTVIIKGDTNCNGRTDSGDAVVLSRNFLYGVALSDAVKLAGDMNGNGRIDSGDAVVMMRNYLYGGSK